MGAEPFVVRWRDTLQGDRIAYNLRGVDLSGRFYGTATNYTNKLQWNIEGSIPDADLRVLHGLIDDIQQVSLVPVHEGEQGGYLGVLAVGTIAKARVVLRCFEGDDEKQEAAQYFRRFVEILRPHARSAYKVAQLEAGDSPAMTKDQ
jgi:hypothetical protein